MLSTNDANASGIDARNILEIHEAVLRPPFSNNAKAHVQESRSHPLFLVKAIGDITTGRTRVFRPS
jgi:hypothetical protein